MRALHIMIVEDEPAIADSLAFAIGREGWRASHYALAGSAEAALAQAIPDLLILDIGLPDGSGLEVLKRLRHHSELPVLLLTARAEELDRVLGLELGADDYVVKPFSPREVVARVRAILKRVGSRSPAVCSSEPMFVHEETARRIYFAGTPLVLTPCEYRLLATLLARPAYVFSRAQLLDALGDVAEDSFERTIDSHIKSLRAKLRQVRVDIAPIVTHRGFGYALEPQ
ncbi:two-component system response regulator CreB [Vogesella amnigena]|uniref:Two-component system response regulator CreB n=1 Tax=Vogesella amnigena TaxID=1507449 RepID=A0ABV7TV54_9NEIS